MASSKYGGKVYQGAPIVDHTELLKELMETIQQLQAEVKALKESLPQLIY